EGAGLARLGCVQLHELAGFGIGQRSEQDSIDHAEDGGICSNAEREREHGHGREAGVFPQLTKGEFEVVHGSLSVVSCPWPFGLTVIHNAAPPLARFWQRGLPGLNSRGTTRKRERALRSDTSNCQLHRLETIVLG